MILKKFEYKPLGLRIWLEQNSSGKSFFITADLKGNCYWDTQVKSFNAFNDFLLDMSEYIENLEGTKRKVDLWAE